MVFLRCIFFDSVIVGCVCNAIFSADFLYHPFTFNFFKYPYDLGFNKTILAHCFLHFGLEFNFKTLINNGTVLGEDYNMVRIRNRIIPIVKWYLPKFIKVLIQVQDVYTLNYCFRIL